MQKLPKQHMLSKKDKDDVTQVFDIVKYNISMIDDDKSEHHLSWKHQAMFKHERTMQRSHKAQ